MCKENVNKGIILAAVVGDRLALITAIRPKATKITVDSAGRIENIGKDLVCWDAIDTGSFLLTENFFRALHELIQRRVTEVTISDVTSFLVGQGHPFDTCDVSGCFWTDIDTKEDLDRVRG